MKNSVGILSLIIVVAFAANTATSQSAKWTRYESDNGKFSALLPPGALIDTERGKSGDLFRIYASGTGVEFTITARKRPDNLILDNLPGSKDRPKPSNDEDFIVSKSEDKLDGIYRASIGIVDKKSLYTLWIEGPSIKDPAIARVLFGLKLGGKPAFPQKTPETEVVDTVLFSNLVSSPEIIEARTRKIENTNGQVRYESSATAVEKTPQPTYSRRAIIVEHPWIMGDPAAIPSMHFRVPELRSNGLNATIRATLRADGQVGDIVFTDTPKGDFSKRVVQAVRKIRFVPAQINGQNVDSEEVFQFAMFYTANR